MAKSLKAIPFIAIPVGMMPCVACQDFKTQPGKMWLGYDRTGGDLVITCPVCHGTAEVPRVKHVHAITGQELNYDDPHQRFIYLDTQ